MQMNLESWDELNGVYRGAVANGTLINLLIDENVVEVPSVNSQTNGLIVQLEKYIGKRIGLLKTNLPEKPFLLIAWKE